MKKFVLAFILAFISAAGTQKLNAQCQAGFTVSDTTGTYYFTDTSQAPSDFITSWAWDFGDGNSSFLQNATNVYGNCGWYIVTLNITTNLGCTSSFTDTILVPGQINASYTFAIDTSDGSAQFTASPVAGTYGYAWDFGDGNTGMGISPTNNYVSAGAYNACLIVFDTTSACTSDTACGAVNVVIIPCNADFTFSVTGSSVSFTDASTAPSDAINSWSWNFGDGNVSTIQNPGNVYTNCGAYIVSLSITTANGCGSTVTDTVVVNTQINGNFTFLVDTMTGDVNFNGLPNDPNFAYTWSFSNGSNGVGQNVTDNFVAGTHTACVVISDTTGACAADTFCNNFTTYIFQPPCNAAFTNTQFSDSLNFTDASTAPGDTINTWSWSFGDGGVSTIQHPNHVYSSCGIYIITLNISTTGGCSSSFTDTVMVGGSIAGAYTYTVNTANGNTQFSATPTGANYSYAWDFGDSTTGSGSNPLHTYTAGTYTACAIISDNSGACTADTVCNSLTVTITCAANFTYTSAGPVFTFTDASTPGLSGTITNWLWNFGDFATSNLQNPVHGYLNCGTYIVSLSIVTSTGCFNTYTDTILVGGQIAGSYTYNVDTITGDVQFNAQPNNANMSFSWDFGDGNTGTNANPTNNYAAGTYNACVIISDNSGACTADTVCDSVFVYIAPPTCNSTFTATDLGGGNYVFNAQPFNFGWQYDWDFGDGTLGNGIIANHQYGAYGSYVVCLTSTDPSTNCTSTFCDTVEYEQCSIDFTWVNNGGGNYTFTSTTTGGGIFPIVAWVFVTDGAATAVGGTTTYQFTSNGLQVICASLNPPPVPGCSDTICHFFFVSGVGMDENPIAQSLKLFPNPTEDEINIQFELKSTSDLSVEIADVVGNKVADVLNAKDQSGAQNIHYSTRELATGIYFVKVRTGDYILTRKIIKN